MTHRRALLVLALFAVGCSPAVRFKMAVRVAGVSAPTPSLLHFSTTVNSADPVPAPWDDPTGYGVKTADGDTIGLALVISEQRVELDARFWYDTDGDGKPSSADRVGRLAAPVVGEDPGILGSNLVDLGLVQLSDAPPDHL